MPRLSRVVRCLVATLMVAAMLPTTSSAQITRGGISGTVRDSSGGVVPGATVTVTNMDTNASQTHVSDAQGFYRAAALEPGRYMVITELTGFRRVEQKEVIVRSALETPVDVRLSPATVGEEVTVTAESPLVGLNRTNPTIASTVNARQVVELPLAGGRNLNNLILTVPNSASTTGQGTFAVNGNRPRNNNYMVDGSDNNDISVTISTSQMVPEAVAEFQVLQNPYSVEFGRNSGGQINVITKSGTNRFSGDIWDYYQASGLNSRTNIEKDNDLATPARLIRHQAGGGVGGPIYRDKAFFFGLYQRDTQRPADRPSATTVTIPTPAGYRGAPERAARRRPDGREPRRRARSDRLPREHVRAEPHVPKPVIVDARQWRVDPDRTDQLQRRRSKHVSHGLGPGRRAAVPERYVYGPLLAERSVR